MCKSFEIADAVPEDGEWIVPLMNAHNVYFWNGGVIWYRYWHQSGSERWIVARPDLGCAHYRVRRDGWKVIDEIVTSEAARRRGVAKAMIEHIGAPIFVKTDCDNEPSNAFYLALGFRLVNVRFARSGKPMNEYALCAV